MGNSRKGCSFSPSPHHPARPASRRRHITLRNRAQSVNARGGGHRSAEAVATPTDDAGRYPIGDFAPMEYNGLVVTQ